MKPNALYKSANTNHFVGWIGSSVSVLAMRLLVLECKVYGNIYVVHDKSIYTLSYIVFRMAQSEPSSGVKGKAIYNKNLSNWFDSFLAGPVLGEHN